MESRFVFLCSNCYNPKAQTRQISFSDFITRFYSRSYVVFSNITKKDKFSPHMNM